ncbi:MAG: helix-turn-helix domain-containing protein [Lachnospiraceae bacterium]|nr:helix-turn-helix domain-containing protein [Lachnospiraceae bacterium]
MDKIEYDKEEVTNLVLLAKGNRSYKSFATAVGVSKSHIYRITRGEYRPGLDTIEKIVNASNDTTGKVSLYSLKRAAAYHENDYKEECKTDNGKVNESNTVYSGKSNVTGNDKSINFKGVSNDSDILDEKKVELKIRQNRFKTISLGLINEGLQDNQITYTAGIGCLSFLNENVIDSVFLINIKGIQEWGFIFYYISEDEDVFSEEETKRFIYLIGQLACIEEEASRKVSIVTNNDKLIDVVQSRISLGSYRGNLSIISVDQNKYRILREEYISRYFLDNIKNDFKIK